MSRTSSASLFVSAALAEVFAAHTDRLMNYKILRKMSTK